MRLYISVSFLIVLWVTIFINCSDDSSSPSGYKITVTDFPSGSGVIQFDPDNERYDTGDTVIIEASADSAHEFWHWLVGSTYYDTNPLELVIDSTDIEITAYYYIIEGEPDCYDSYADVYNGGCQDASDGFLLIQSGEAFSGKTGVYNNGDYRDTDWYEYIATGNMHLTFEATADFGLQLYIVDGTDGCDYYYTLESGTCYGGDTITVTTDVNAGTYWMVATTRDWNEDIECGSDYAAWFSASPISNVNTVKHETSRDVVKAAKSE